MCVVGAVGIAEPLAQTAVFSAPQPVPRVPGKCWTKSALQSEAFQGLSRHGTLPPAQPSLKAPSTKVPGDSISCCDPRLGGQAGQGGWRRALARKWPAAGAPVSASRPGGRRAAAGGEQNSAFPQSGAVTHGARTFHSRRPRQAWPRVKAAPGAAVEQVPTLAPRALSALSTGRQAGRRGQWEGRDWCLTLAGLGTAGQDGRPGL